ncbi:MAG: efflux RND transporter periplasmic adaptor subunit [Hyphomicrobiaceae bacterium]
MENAVLAVRHWFAGLHAKVPVVLVVVAGLVAVLAINVSGRGAAVGTATVRRGSAAEVVYATGVVEPVHWAKVTALARKRIDDICKCEGQVVKKGDVLVRLDDIEERAMLTELEARLARMQSDVERITKLVQRNIAPRASLDEKLTQIDEQNARILALRDRIADLALKSPIDGIVLRRDGEIGEIAGIGANDTLLWVGQPKPLQLVAEVNEDDIARVEKGQRALLRHEGTANRRLEGTVARITPKGDPQTKTFRVYIALPDDTPLHIGMSVEANIVVSEITNGLLLPAEAVGDHAVQLIKDGRVVGTPVEIGIRGAGLVEIRSGVGEGDVAVSPFRKDLANGAAVRIGGAR